MPQRVANPAALVREVLEGSPGATGRLVDAWLPVVLGWCLRLSGPSVDAEDAAHDVMITMLDRLDDVKHPERFAGWLFQVTRTVLRRHRRRQWFARWMPASAPEHRDPSPDPASTYARSEVARRVRLALDAVPPLYREVLVLCDVEEYSGSEVAEMLEVPLGTVKSRLRLGRQRLRRAAEREGLGPVLLDAYDRGEL